MIAAWLVSAPVALALDPHRAIAERFAPVLYQDVADGLTNDPERRRWDFITAVDFDGNLDATDNVENTDSYPLPGVVYYEAVETETHLFLLYSLFHPIDWNDLNLIDHENDLEQVWLVLVKGLDGDPSLRVVHTQAHGQLFAWADDPPGGPFPVSDGGLDLEGDHPRIFVEAHGHGPVSCSHGGGLPFLQAIDCSPSPDEDMVVYRVAPGAAVTDIAEPDTAGAVVEARYALVHGLDALWPYRAYIEGDGVSPPLWDQPFTYASGRGLDIDPGPAWMGGDFAGDEGGGVGTPPWAYHAVDSWLFGTHYGEPGDWLLDPAILYAAMYDDPCEEVEGFDNYVYNPYLEAVLAGTPPYDGVDAGRRCDGIIEGPDTGDTGAVDTGPVDTGDPEAGDTGAEPPPDYDTGDTASEPAQEPSAPPEEAGCGCSGGATWMVALPLLAWRRRR